MNGSTLGVRMARLGKIVGVRTSRLGSTVGGRAGGVWVILRPSTVLQKLFACADTQPDGVVGQLLATAQPVGVAGQVFVAAQPDGVVGHVALTVQLVAVARWQPVWAGFVLPIPLLPSHS